MPRKPKFTKDEVIDAAYQITLKEGIDAITAQSVAEYMNYTGSSLFTHFDSVYEIKKAVYQRTLNLFNDYLSDCKDYFPVFKAFGMRWVKFAYEYPNLYRLIYSQRGKFNDLAYNPLFKSITSYPVILNDVMNNFSLDEKDAEELIGQMIIHGNGLAAFVASGYIEYDEYEISKLLSEACIGQVFLMQFNNGSFIVERARAMSKATCSLPKKR